VDGARIIDRVAASLKAHCQSLVIAPGSLDARGWLRDAGIAPDMLPVKASITGIHAALVGAGTDIVAIAWDMPFVPAALVGAMTQRARESTNWSAVVPIVNGRPEPLCAVYSKAAVQSIAEAVRAGLVKNSDVLAKLPGVIWLEEPELAPFGDPAVMFFNVNTPADLNRAEEIAQESGEH
jgi:molybdopterin-guanine dinucleotide biosynthesis protein A